MKECRELEEVFGLNGILNEERWGSVMKMKLRQVDREQHMLRCKEKAPLIARIEEEIEWRKLWGDLLDYCHCWPL